MKVFSGKEITTVQKSKIIFIRLGIKFHPVIEKFQVDFECLRTCSHECFECELLKLCLALDVNGFLELP